MKRIVISAFAPFGAYPANSSEMVAQRLARHEVAPFEVFVFVFSATIPTQNRGEMLVEHAQVIGAAGIISLGMASEKKGLCIEEWAANAVENAKYCPLELQRTSIDPREVYGRRIALDLAPWNIARLRQECAAENIVLERSGDAGGFCCNHLAYQTRRAIIDGGQDIPYTFIHLPCCPEAVPDYRAFSAAGKVSMPVRKMTQGIELLLQHAAL